MNRRPFSASSARERLRRLDQGDQVHEHRYRKILHSEERRWYLVVTMVIMIPPALALAVLYFQHSLPALR
ncbi:hypothetical protein [Halotalea alkalilenta]|uniref:hypothetical protein n=1 Tax=Halotalea alkalilenta TaxID=376489 RepID=UPI000483CA6D|nr:hypothetical protein [Halotalea alkalilenta]